MTFAELVKDIDFLLFGNSTATSPYVIADKVRNLNSHYDNAAVIIMKADHNWEWDDNNKTDLPVATAALVANQEDYGITAVDFLKVLKVELKDTGGNWNPLFPITLDDKRQVSMTDYMKTAGVPKEYDKLGNSIFLKPKPNYSQAASLKVWYQRNVNHFTISSSSEVPGFIENFHRYLSFGAALDYAIAHGMTGKISIIAPLMTKMEENLVAFYAGRDRDQKQTLSLDREDYGASTGEDTGLGNIGFTN